MPNRKQHLIFAVITGGIVMVLASLIKIQLGFGFFGGFVFASILPDILEPPTDYKHRKKFHSKEAGKTLLILAVISFILGLISFLLLKKAEGFWSVTGFSLGYVSHLLLDSTTPMGLPDE